MPGSLYNANNVVIGQAVGWFAPYLQPTPTDMPPDTLALWGSWPTPWVGAGATEEGYSTEATMKTQDHTIEEQSTPVAQTVTAAGMVTKAALAEDTLQTIKLAWNGSTIVTTAAGAGTPGTDKMTLSSNVVYYSFGLEMMNAAGFARRIYIPKVSVMSSEAVKFRRAEGKRTYGIEITSLSAPEEIQIVDITALGT